MIDLGGSTFLVAAFSLVTGLFEIMFDIKQEYTHLLVENPQQTGGSSEAQNRFGLAICIFHFTTKSASFLDHKADALKGRCQSCSELSHVLNFVFALQRHFGLRKVA